MCSRGVGACDLQQAIADELTWHQELLLERFAEHEATILEALALAVAGPALEPSLCGAVDSDGGSVAQQRSVLSPKILLDGIRGRRESAFVHRLVGHHSSERSVGCAWVRQRAPIGGQQSFPGGAAAAPTCAQVESQEDPEQLPNASAPPSPGASIKILPPEISGTRHSIRNDSGASARDSAVPSALAEFDQPEQPAVKRNDTSKSFTLSNAASGFRKVMSYCTDNADDIDQTSRVATTLKELVGAEQDVHHRVGGLRGGTSFMSIMSVDGRQMISKKAHGMLGSPYFETTVVLLILVNAVTIGMQTNDAMRSPHPSASETLQILEFVFLSAFTVELTIRIVAEKAYFISRSNVNLKWNMFDFVVVVAGIVDAILEATAGDAPSISAIRLIRILRLARALRILRIVKFFSAFRVMVAGILGSLKVLSFAVMLLTLLMYIFAVVILQFAAQELHDSLKGQGALQPAEYDALLQHFDSLPGAVFSLYASILGGLDWSEAATPLMALNPFLGGLFMLYIAFAVLCVLNIVTGVFVENANKITSQDEGRELLSQLTRKKEWLNEAIKLFKVHDTDGSGTIAWEEFEECAKDVKVQAWFRKIGVDVEAQAMQSLWELLDLDGDGQVDIDEFVMALQQIHGQARSIDMARVKYEVRQIRKKLDAILGRASERRRLMSKQTAYAGKHSATARLRESKSSGSSFVHGAALCAEEGIVESSISGDGGLPGNPQHSRG